MACKSQNCLQQQFTWQKLSRLNSRHNAHVAYQGKVYNVSAFLDKHPGGANQLMFGAGRDITQLFQCYHKLGTSKLIEEKCQLVGELVDTEMPTFPMPVTDRDFLTTVRSRVARHFTLANIDPKVSYLVFARYFLFVILSLGFWYAGINANSSLWLSIPYAAAAGFFSAMVTLTLGHDGNHFAITHKPWVWKLLSIVGDSIHGLSSLSWVYQHDLGHHIYTNFDEIDPDIVSTCGLDGKDIWRIKPLQKWFSRYLFQHFYVPFLYAFFAIKKKLEDFHNICSLKKDTIRMNPASTSQLAVFVIAKTINFTLRYFIPLLILPLPRVILVNMAHDAVMSLWLSLITVLTHINTGVEWVPVHGDPSKPCERDWAELQLATTQDYATSSWFWTVFSGASNHQVSHHLFPSVLQYYYPVITPIVKQTCAEFGLPYRYAPSAWEAWCLHVNHLKAMGKKPTD